MNSDGAGVRRYGVRMTGQPEASHNSHRSSAPAKAALIIGAGIGGMQAALMLGEMGAKAYLLDNAPAIGGAMPLLDRTFITDSCGLCQMSPDLPAHCPFIECALHPNIQLLPYAEVQKVSGEVGRFHVRVRCKARYVDADRCIGCGDCASVCPIEMPRELGQGVEHRRAIYRPYPQAIPRAYLIDMDGCTRCGRCIAVCPTHAIDLDVPDHYQDLDVAAIIVSTGCRPVDGRIRGEYGYGMYPNVVTSYQFERMLSLTGPSRGLPLRPTDGRVAKRIAFLQCVGSRDISRGQGHCSSVCCMYTAKQATTALDRLPDAGVSVFYVDVRAYGKGHERYHREAVRRGVEYVRSQVSSIKEVPESRGLRLVHAGEAGTRYGPKETEFDLVVLAVGLCPPPGVERLAEQLGIGLNAHRYAETRPLTPTVTATPGVFVAGSFREPKDIADTVSDACAATASAAALLLDPLPTHKTATETAAAIPSPRADRAADEVPHIGVFLCGCGGEISDVLDLERIADRAGRQPDVEWVKIVPDMCGPDFLTQFVACARENQLTRLVVAACSRPLLRPEVEDSIRRAGLDVRALVWANLREQCALVHKDHLEGANARAMAEVLAAIHRARWRAVAPVPSDEIIPGVLVVGAGAAGMTAALRLAEQGVQVHLVEKSNDLGGNLRSLRNLLSGEDPQLFLADLVARVRRSPRVQLYREARVTTCDGYPGRYRSAIRIGGRSTVEVEFGAVVVAAGGKESVPTGYLCGRDARVCTQRQLEMRLEKQLEGGFPPDRVVMIQCVGSRNEARPYCSRICCSQAIKNALILKGQHPCTEVYVLYRDIQANGFLEDEYLAARRSGVIFLPYVEGTEPQVLAQKDRLRVRVHTAVPGLNICGWTDDFSEDILELETDLLVLSVGITPDEDNRQLARTLGVPLDEDGFFQEANPKARPLDFERRGFFLCGLAHGPKALSETLAQAEGAAARALAYLRRRRTHLSATLAYVNSRLCSGCELCVSVCPYGARCMDPERRVALVLERLCVGCGACAAACPNGATQQRQHEFGLELATLEIALD